MWRSAFRPGILVLCVIPSLLVSGFGASVDGHATSVSPAPPSLTWLSGPGVSVCDDVTVHGDQRNLLDTHCNTREIRPGAAAGCTLNFIMTDGDRYYIGTAGHCGGVGAVFHVSGVGRVGEVVFREFSNSLFNVRDWALILVDEDKESYLNPSMYRFGGPFAAAPELMTRPPLPGDLVFLYGNGAGFGREDPTKGRVGQVSVLLGTTAFGYVGTVGGGDSGSPVRFASGEAAGIAVAVAGVSLGDNRDFVHDRCATVQGATGIAGACTPYDFACGQLDDVCRALWAPGALHGLVVVARFDAALAAFEDFLGRDLAIVPGELPGVSVGL